MQWDMNGSNAEVPVDKSCTSPFGDYETWIREFDYECYLHGYPGYDLPTMGEVDNMTQTISDMLSRRSDEVRKRDAAFEKALKRADPSGGSMNADAGRNVGNVSCKTIARAMGSRHAQGVQIQGSVTTTTDGRYSQSGNLVFSFAAPSAYTEALLLRVLEPLMRRGCQPFSSHDWRPSKSSWDK
ncbi:hypothetical protein VTK56DRAFT_2810 [Thermocarpiscus australiensis]